MTVEASKRTAWTDPRLDDLGKKVDAGFAKLDKKFDKLMWWLLGGATCIALALIGHATHIY